MPKIVILEEFKCTHCGKVVKYEVDITKFFMDEPYKTALRDALEDT